MPSTNDDLAKRIDDLFPSVRRDLETLVRIPSVSLSGHDTDVRRSAETTRDLLAAAGFENTQLLELGSAHPAVFGEIPAPDGAPTVLLYAHHDVQPPGPAELWTSDPFEPVERNGRLYGRGTSDDKAGIAVHLGAIRAHDGRPPVGVKVFIEGEEEVGSEHLPQYIDTFHELLASDVIVIADSGNWQVGTPCLTTSLRGLVDLEVEVRTLEKGVHSGLFGGVVPDALTVLCRTLATLHNEDGSVAVAGLVGGEAEPLPITDDDVKAIAGCHPELELIGDGHLTSRMWTQPAISVLAMDAPPLDQAINQLLPSARAKVSMRLAPGQDPAAAMDALASHLEANVPWGAQVTIERGSSGDAMSMETDGPAYDAFRDAFRQAWGVEPAEIGVGGSIPFVAAFQEAYPEASILLTGVGDSTSRQHGPDESQDLDELRRGMLAEAIALQLLAEA